MFKNNRKLEKKLLLIIISSVITIAVGIGLYFFILQQSTKINPEPKPEQIKKDRLFSMSLDEKIGQLLIVGFESKYLDEHVQKMITQYHIGGINLLKRNIENENQIKQLIKDLQGISKIPLFIATDQEGGNTVRFNFLNQLTPQIRIIDAKQAEKIAFERATELKSLGVNMNFSPVMDYVSDSNSYLYSRTFGTDPDSIWRLGESMIIGYRKGGIIPVAKHFPGYGDIFLDPHTHKAISIINNKEFEQRLVPFKEISMSNSVEAIMTAHIVIPLIDTKPATLSSKFLTEILRNQFGFQGIIITDDIEMASVGNLTAGDTAVEAIKAGADIIISSYNPEKPIEIFNVLKTSVITGEIKEERINESVIRILKVKSLLK